jgi:hypothetical protein
MNKKPIESARDEDLRHSVAAIRRAARRAHKLARETGTAIVISRNGVVEHLQPDAFEFEPLTVQEPGTPYGKKP